MRYLIPMMLLTVGCGPTAQETYDLEKAKLETLEANLDELVIPGIMERATSLKVDDPLELEEDSWLQEKEEEIRAQKKVVAAAKAKLYAELGQPLD